MKKLGYIYKTVNKKNDKIYIGQHIGQFDPHYLGSGLLISRAVRKNGVHSFEVKILAEAGSKKRLDELEIKYIAEYRKKFPKRLYNIRDGGDGWPCGSKNPACDPKIRKKLNKVLAKIHSSPEFSKRMSEIASRRTGVLNPMYGKRHSLRTKNKQSMSARKLKGRYGMSGKSHSIETRKAIGKSNSGPNPNRRIPKSKSCIENMKKGWIKRKHKQEVVK